MVLGSLQSLVLVAFYLAILVLCVWGLVDLLRRPAGAFVAAGKLTKGRWGAILGASTAVSFVALPWPLGIGALSFLALLAAVAAIVYLVDVRPALGPTGRRRPPARGGW